MAWISEALQVYGFINRQHLQRKFDISCPQAAIDFREYQKRHPGAMEYDASRKAYVSASKLDS
ncbi:hypothetical protein [Labrenzia sp. DG1229]|uniref:hypothetical protein n=1 Tax=Labrenzia sp. DG1229 TaxID=681847 RepID=UPI00048BB322|nr:hypothetical protein [Labrenzia sp. DG1229]